MLFLLQFSLQKFKGQQQKRKKLWNAIEPGKRLKTDDWIYIAKTIIWTLFHNNTSWRLKDTAQAKLIGTLTSQESDA